MTDKSGSAPGMDSTGWEWGWRAGTRCQNIHRNNRNQTRTAYVKPGQFQDLCEFVEMAIFEDATYL